MPGLYMHFYYFSISPRIADPSTGHIYPISNHGPDAFVTLPQHLIYESLSVLPFAFFVLVASIWNKYRDKKRSKRSGALED